MRGGSRVEVSEEQAFEILQLGLGALHPLKGFPSLEDVQSIVETYKTSNGEVIGLPILMELSDTDLSTRRDLAEVNVFFRGELIAHISDGEVFEWDPSSHAEKVFGTSSESHPGVRDYLSLGKKFLSGAVTLNKASSFISRYSNNSPEAVRAAIRALGWQTVVGFQTRNIPHKAHEQLIRLSLELNVDGVLIHPLVGPRRVGDFNETAIVDGYTALINNYLPTDRVLLKTLHARMHYGGPREALLHALMRRNYGCSHFIVGRDHAGIGGFYEEYESQALAMSFVSELRIEILPFAGPYFCSACDGMVSRKSCCHFQSNRSVVREFSGTAVRNYIREGVPLKGGLLRPEVAASLPLKPFLEEEAGH